MRRLPLAIVVALLLAPASLWAQAASPSESTDDTRARAQQDAEQIAQHLLEVREQPAELDCPKAVENARYGVETMLEVGEKNVRGGYMKAEQFNAVATPLRALLPTLTLADCEAADGNKRAFYQCMSSDYNHVMGCGKAHPY